MRTLRCAMAYVGKLAEYLRTFVDAFHNPSSGRRVILCNVREYILKPRLSFPSPIYPCQARILRCISSLDSVRPASESASPRCTIRLKASSRTSSSYELSSGCCAINCPKSSLAVDIRSLLEDTIGMGCPTAYGAAAIPRYRRNTYRPSGVYGACSACDSTSATGMKAALSTSASCKTNSPSYTHENTLPHTWV